LRFEEFNLAEEVMEGIMAMGYETPTPVQVQCVPVILGDKDLIACAQTGTGKTAAFLLPLIHKILKQDLLDKGASVMVIVPTRELALQIDQQLQGFAYFVPVSSIAVYGGGDGDSWEKQTTALKNGVNIIIATPGRLISQLSLGNVDCSNIQFLVLDEADRMLDMGFFEDITSIISYLPKKRQTLMFSATMPPKIRTLAKTTLVNPVEVNIALSKPAEGVLQAAYIVHDHQKLELLKSLLLGKDMKSVLVFSSTKINVKNIAKDFKKAGLSVAAIHSDLEQKERETVLSDYRNRKFQVLVATDILSRGIDIDGIDLVVNYDVPPDAEDYIHRVGRTARAEATGVAITFVNQDDLYLLKKIEELIGSEIHKIPNPEWLGEGPDPSVITRRMPYGRSKSGGKRPGDNRKPQGGRGFRK
jgi:ATP-dependent RNA helicase RhlE